MNELLNSLKLLKAEVEKASHNNQIIRLSELALTLSVTNATLGEHLARAKSEYEKAKASVYISYLDIHKTTKAEALSKADTVELKTRVDGLEIIHKDNANIVTVIQTRIRILEQELKGSNI